MIKLLLKYDSKFQKKDDKSEQAFHSEASKVKALLHIAEGLSVF